MSQPTLHVTLNILTATGPAQRKVTITLPESMKGMKLETVETYLDNLRLLLSREVAVELLHTYRKSLELASELLDLFHKIPAPDEYDQLGAYFLKIRNSEPKVQEINALFQQLRLRMEYLSSQETP